MSVNINALKKLQESFEQGDGLYVFANNIKDELDIRLLPPLKNMNEIWFLEQVGYWIEGKYYISPETFGRDCPIAEEVEKAMAQEDEDLNELLNDKQNFAKKSRYLFPVLVLNAEFDAKGNPVKVSVEGNKAKVMVSGQMLIKAINQIWCSRQYQNGTDDGIADRIDGYNILLSKKGKKLNTEYSAIAWREPWEMPEKYYNEKEIPDIVAMTRNEMKLNDYLRAVIRNYLYGEPMPKEGKDKDEDVPKRKNKTVDDDDDVPRNNRRKTVEDDDDENPRFRKMPKFKDEYDDVPKNRNKKSVDADDRLPFGDDEDEKPAKKASKTVEDDDVLRRGKRQVEDEEDEILNRKNRAGKQDEDELLKMKKKKSLLDSLDNVD